MKKLLLLIAWLLLAAPTGVVGIDELADGFTVRLVWGRTITITSATIPTAVRKKTFAEVQAWVDNWCLTANGGRWTDLKINLTSIVPLKGGLAISNSALPADYWIVQ